MKSHFLVIFLVIFVTSNLLAQPTDNGGGGGFPFGEPHRKAWDGFSIETRKQMIIINNLSLEYFSNLGESWKSCYHNSLVPNSFVDIYVHFNVQRQLKTMEANEQFDSCKSHDHHLFGNKALRKEKHREKCIFQGANKKIMKDILGNSQIQRYFELKYNLKPEEAEKMTLFYKDLI